MIKEIMYMFFLAFMFILLNAIKTLVSTDFINLMAMLIAVLFIIMLIGFADKYVIRSGR